MRTGSLSISLILVTFVISIFSVNLNVVLGKDANIISNDLSRLGNLISVNTSTSDTSAFGSSASSESADTGLVNTVSNESTRDTKGNSDTVR